MKDPNRGELTEDEIDTILMMHKYPVAGPDALVFEWLERQSDPRIIMAAMLRNWHMFMGDSYYREWQSNFMKACDRIVEAGPTT